MILSPNTPRNLKAELTNLFGVETSTKLGKYLGVYVDDRNDLKRNFDDLLRKINVRLAGWKSHLLSQAGRVTLIKSVIQSDPVYKLSCLQAPRKVTDAINGAMTNFFWGFRGEKARAHLLNRKILFRPKHEGGLGFRDSSAVNKALLAKYTWRILNNPQSIVASWVKNRYLIPHSDFDFRPRSSASIVWKGVRNSAHIITDHVVWRLGRGDKIDIRSRFWESHIDGTPSGILVNDLVDFSTYSWDLDKINLVCSEEQAANLVRTPCPTRHVLDTLIWTPAASGSYTTAEGFKLLSGGNHSDQGNITSTNFPWKDFWRTKAPMRVLLTAWKIFNDAIPTFSNLNRHHLQCDIVCPMCGDPDDSTSHTFLCCNFARAVWFGLPISIRYHPTNSSFRTWFTSWFIRWRRNKDRFAETWLTILVSLDVIWNYRNKTLWKNAKPDPSAAIRIIQSLVLRYVNVYYCQMSVSTYDTNAFEFFTSSSHESRELAPPAS